MNDHASAAAREATEWIDSTPGERSRALQDLLELADALPPERPPLSLSLPETVIATHDALAANRIPHAFGGVLAVAYYGVPELTKRIELKVFLPSQNGAIVNEALKSLGIEVETDESIFVSLSNDEFNDEMQRGARQVPFAETRIPILGPEHLMVCKAMFDRAKDWLDIEQILVATSPIEVEEIESLLVGIVGEADPRVGKLREIRRRLRV